MYEINYQSGSSERVEVRKELLEVFSSELPGTGAGDLSTKYRYFVEVYGNYKIYLCRPAPLNKGLDFIVRIDGLFFKKNRRYNNPGHNDIVQALLYVKGIVSEDSYSIIAEEIQNIFHHNTCDIDKVSTFSFLDYNDDEHPLVIILLAMKWLFIEQDMTYWNWSGRQMLMTHLQSAGLI